MSTSTSSEPVPQDLCEASWKNFSDWTWVETPPEGNWIAFDPLSFIYVVAGQSPGCPLVVGGYYWTLEEAKG